MIEMPLREDSDRKILKDYLIIDAKRLRKNDNVFVCYKTFLNKIVMTECTYTRNTFGN
jgi:hypothetical protein